MADYVSARVQCPFYLEKQNDQFRIKCEGVVKGTSTQLTFRGDKRRYMKDFCCKNYKQCRVYLMLNNKYKKQIEAEG